MRCEKLPENEAKGAGMAKTSEFGAGDRVVAIYTTWPDADVEIEVAGQLVGERLIACANVLPGATAIYEWNGSVQQDTEVPVILKTTARCQEAVIAAVKARHPYDVPAIIVLDAAGGDTAYLAWIASQTQQPSTPQGTTDSNSNSNTSGVSGS